MMTAWVFGVAGLMTLGFAANEMSHGGVSEMMGLGHRHMSDYGGYHCAGHNQTMMDQHMAQMRASNGSAMHGGACGSGGGMMDGGMHG